MIAFEVSVNGARRYVAGHPDARMLSVMLMGSLGGPHGMPPSFGVHGSVAVPAAGEQLDTLMYPSDYLAAGDEVTIRLVEVQSADPPARPKEREGSIELVVSQE